MKTERRHQLQQNVLAERLAKVISRISPYTKWLAWAALIASLVLLASAVWYYYRTHTASIAWQEYIEALASANRRTALQDLASNRPDSAVGIWAKLALADADLAMGEQMVYQNRDEAERTLKNAIETYNEILESAPRSVFLEQRAEFGLAQANEILGALKEAQKHYQRVLDLAKDTALGKQAEQHLAL